MKALFLRSVRVKEHVEEKDNIIYKEDEQGNLKMDMFNGWYDDLDSPEVQAEAIKTAVFDSSDYEKDINKHKSKVEVVIKNTDGFRKYNLDTSSIVDYKTARTSVEEKRPFIVSKRGKKLNKTEDIDTIYKTSPKMTISNKSVHRLGFIVADEKARLLNLKDKKKRQFKGIANDEYMITKKKGFNQKKIGYLKLEESTATKDLYVEVTTNRGYKWLLTLLMILGIIGLIIFTRDYTGWHFNLDNLRLYKTKEVTEYKESELSIMLNATPVLKDGLLNINLSSEEADGLSYIAKLYTANENKLIYESEEMPAGKGVKDIEITESLPVGEYECYLECESYRNGNYIGTVESNLQLKVKE